MSRPPRQPVNQAPRVTDHALLRFLARTGMDVEAVRGSLEAALGRAHGAALALGGVDHVILVDGMRFVVRAGAVVTVLLSGGLHEDARVLEPREPS